MKGNYRNKCQNRNNSKTCYNRAKKKKKKRKSQIINTKQNKILQKVSITWGNKVKINNQADINKSSNQNTNNKSKCKIYQSKNQHRENNKSKRILLSNK